jgi:diadenosine tetraphosphate (Ap4A) HIT family hydrolase
MSCPFCEHDREIVAANRTAFAIFDNYPVSKGHTLVIPNLHVASIFELNPIDYSECFQLVRKVRIELTRRFKANDFNIGVNCGGHAGQTVDHAHIHIIPRYEGDISNPRGGVRNLIPGKGDY